MSIVTRIKNYFKQAKADFEVKKKYWTLKIQAITAAATTGWIVLPDEVKQNLYDSVSDVFAIRPSYFVLGVTLATIWATFYRQKSVAEAVEEKAKKERDAETIEKFKDQTRLFVDTKPLDRDII